MVSAIVYQLTKGLSADEIRRQGFDTYFVDHTAGVWPQAAGGTPFTSMCFASKGDAITDIQIRGVKVLDPDVVLMRLSTRKGDVVDPATLNEEIKRIWDLATSAT